MLTLKTRNLLLLGAIFVSGLVILQNFVPTHRGVNAAVGQITWVKCVLQKSTAVQIAQVTIRVPQIHAQYIFNMLVSTDCHQSVSVNLRILSLNCQSWNTAKRGISR